MFCSSALKPFKLQKQGKPSWVKHSLNVSLFSLLRKASWVYHATSACSSAVSLVTTANPNLQILLRNVHLLDTPMSSSSSIYHNPACNMRLGQTQCEKSINIKLRIHSTMDACAYRIQSHSSTTKCCLQLPISSLPSVDASAIAWSSGWWFRTVCWIVDNC